MNGCVNPTTSFNKDIKMVHCELVIGQKIKELIQVEFEINNTNPNINAYRFILNRILKDPDNKTKKWEPIDIETVRITSTYVLLYNKDEKAGFSSEYFYELVISNSNGTTFEDIYHTRAFSICKSYEYLKVLSLKNYDIYEIPLPDTKHCYYSPGNGNLTDFLDLESTGHSPLYDLQLVNGHYYNKKPKLTLIGKIKNPYYPERKCKVNIIVLKKLFSEFTGGKQTKWLVDNYDVMYITKESAEECNLNQKSKLLEFKTNINLDNNVLNYIYRIVLTDSENMEWLDTIVTVPMKIVNYPENPRIELHNSDKKIEGSFVPIIVDDKKQEISTNSPINTQNSKSNIIGWLIGSLIILVVIFLCIVCFYFYMKGLVI